MRAVTSEDVRPGVRQRLTKEERRSRILDAAARVFGERGYDGASIDEIAEEAGITKPVIYDHFRSKRELHIALFELHTGQMLDLMEERVAGEASPERQLAAGLDAIFEWVETHPYAWRIIMRDPAPADPEIVEAHHGVQERATGAIAALLASSAPFEGPDRDVGIQLIAQVIKSAVNGLASWWYVHQDVPRDQLVESVMDAVWMGLGRFLEGERWGEPPSRVE
jgi:AcrR family transcriptional regulator